MDPIYTTERVSLYHGTAEEVIESLPKTSYDLLVTDPPYGVNFRSNRGQNFTSITGDDESYNPIPTINTAISKMRHNRHGYVFGPQSTRLILTQQVTLIWDKIQIGMGNLKLPWGPQHEIITFGVWVPSKANRDRGDGRLVARMRQGSVIRTIRPNSMGVKRHPTEKPTELLRQLIESSSLIGETVFDPYAGSGSTGVAALLEGRKAILVEVDEQYIESTIQRLVATEQWLDTGQGL